MRDVVPFDDLQATPAPFGDANFKLTVLDALMEAGQLDFGDFPEFLQAIEGPHYDDEVDGYVRSDRAYDYLSRYPLSAEHLDAVTELYFDGGLSVYSYVHPFWGGETEEFDIRSLADIGLLPKLRVFEIASMSASTDLAPLRQVQALEVVGLGLSGTWKNFDALEALPNLTELGVFSHDLTPASLDVLRRLEARGVSVPRF